MRLRSRVHPDDRPIILLAGASVTDEGSVVVRPLGCVDREIASFDLTPEMSETHWRVDLERGFYQLDVFARFQSTDGRSGDVSGSLGLLVDSSSVREVVPVDPKLAVCPFSD